MRSGFVLQRNICKGRLGVCSEPVAVLAKMVVRRTRILVSLLRHGISVVATVDLPHWLALCTSSLRISIFSAPETAGGGGGCGGQQAADAQWTEVARMERAHTGPIWRLSWGHPEHGDPLASCSEDRTVTVWYGGRASSVGAGGAPKGQQGAALPRWQERAQLSCEGPVVDVRFAPAPLGLKVAACTSDGKARIFECVNALDLRTWEPE
ncbi:unnamed protein product, partial [Polarella glacialis]